MPKTLRRYWLILPIIASMATQCGESPRGAPPTEIVTIDLRLDSQPAPPPADAAAFLACLSRMNLENNVEPSWQNGQVVPLNETDPNVFTARFFDVPTGFANTMTVHDQNECRRDPDGEGHVTMGVTVNGQAITRVVGVGALAFTVDTDGNVSSPPIAGPTLQ